MAKLIVMVSIYDSGDFIENRLENLSQTTNIDKEVWCVNADSPDERDEIIPKKFVGKNFKYIRLPQRISVYAAWNYILKRSKGVYVTNANCDDLIAPAAYERLTKYLDTAVHCGLVYPSWYNTSIPNQKWQDFAGKRHDGNPGFYKGDLNKGGVGHFPVWRKNLHNQLGYFDESFQALADADWWARCWYIGKMKFKWFPLGLAAYLWRDGENLWTKAINEDEWRRYHEKVARYKQGIL